MRIEYLTTGLEVGGAERVVVELAAGMRERGHEVSITSLIPPTAHVDELAARGVTVRSLGINRARKSPSQLATALLVYRGAVARRAPHIVHAHMVHANLFGRLGLALQPSLRLICTIHNTDEGGRLRDLCYRLTNWASRLDTTISAAATTRFVSAGVLPLRTRTVHNGIVVPPTPPKRPLLAGRFRWIAIGRLEPQKDYPVLLAAMAALPAATLTIVGDGSLRTQLEAMARQLGIAERVDFLGIRNDVSEQLARHDGYVLPSAWEGFGLALAEAMAMQLPVVATRAGGPVEIVGEDGAGGRLIPPGDPVALAAAMGEIMAMPPAARATMGERARDRVADHFSLDAMLNRWQAIYAEIGA